MEAEDPVMRERLVGLKLQRDQIAKEIGELQNRMASSGRRGDGPRSSRAPRVATHATECQASSRRHGKPASAACAIGRLASRISNSAPTAVTSPWTMGRSARNQIAAGPGRRTVPPVKPNGKSRAT